MMILDSPPPGSALGPILQCALGSALGSALSFVGSALGLAWQVQPRSGQKM